MPLNLLVTGGAGYIGSHTILEILNCGHSVVCVDNCFNAYKSEKDELPESLIRVQDITGKNLKFYQVDLRDRKALDDVFKNNKIDCVVHFAAMKAVGESVKIPLQYYQNNITGTCTLLEVMADNGVFNLLFSSSSTVYGSAKVIPTSEDHPTGACTNPYGRTKYMCEEIMKDVCISDERWRIVSLRYFNPIGTHGSGRIGEYPKGIPKNIMPYLSQVAIGKLDCFTVFGGDYDTPDGTAIRDYSHVLDIAEGHLAALNSLEADKISAGFSPYNLGCGAGISVLEMVKGFSAACGKDIPYVIGPRRSGDVPQTCADPSKAEREFGWKAARGVKEMCESAWIWQKMNPNGFEDPEQK